MVIKVLILVRHQLCEDFQSSCITVRPIFFDIIFCRFWRYQKKERLAPFV